MALNPGKYYYMTFGLNTTKNEFTLGDDTIVPAAEQHVLLGKTTDSRSTFYYHLKQLCKKVANKLNALTRIAPDLSYSQTAHLLFFFYWTIKLLTINIDLLFQTIKLYYNQTYNELLQ